MDARVVPGIITAVVVGTLFYTRRRYLGDDAVKGDMVGFTVKGSGAEDAFVKANFPAATEGLLLVDDTRRNTLTGSVLLLSDGQHFTPVDAMTYPELAHVGVDRSSVSKIGTKADLAKVRAAKKNAVPITAFPLGRGV